MRKAVGIIIGLGILLAILLAIFFYDRSVSESLAKDETQTLVELRHSLSTIDDLEQRGILSAEVAQAERQRRAAKAQTSISAAHVQALIRIKYTLATLDDLQERGILSAEVTQAEKRHYLVEARNILGGTLELDQLPVLLEHLDSQQESSGFPTTIILWVLLGALLVAGASWFILHRLAAARTISRRSSDQPAAAYSAGEGVEPSSQGKLISKSGLLLHLLPARRRAGEAASSATRASEPPKLPLPLTEPLTERELEVLQLVAEGLTNREIAQRLFITPGTAKVHISNIYSKLGVKRRMQAVAGARELGIIPPQQ